jgi:glutaredoxin 3
MLEKTIIYTIKNCPSCVRAKNLLQEKGYSFQEIDVTNNPENLREQLMERTKGQRTLPQVFINEHHVGGYEALQAFLHEQKP